MFYIRVIGNATGFLCTLKGLPRAYNKVSKLNKWKERQQSICNGTKHLNKR